MPTSCAAAGPPVDKWHLDEVFIPINGERMYLWRAVDQDGVVLDILVQSRRNAKAAKQFFRKLLRCPRQRGVGQVAVLGIDRNNGMRARIRGRAPRHNVGLECRRDTPQPNHPGPAGHVECGDDLRPPNIGTRLATDMVGGARQRPYHTKSFLVGPRPPQPHMDSVQHVQGDVATGEADEVAAPERPGEPHQQQGSWNLQQRRCRFQRPVSVVDLGDLGFPTFCRKFRRIPRRLGSGNVSC